MIEKSVEMRRRDLLKIGTAGALSSLVIGGELVAAPEISNVARAAGLWLTSPLSVGYWDGKVGSTVVASTSIRQEDSSFAQTGAQVTLRGLRSTSGDPSFDGVDVLSVDVSYRPFTNVDYLAWIMDNTGYQKSSSSVSAYVPISAMSGLTLNVGLKMSGGSLQKVPVTLVTQLGFMSPKLKDGYYFIGLSDSAFNGVDWSSYSALSAGNGATLSASSVSSNSSVWGFRASSAPPDLIYFVFEVRHPS